jgi:hypothetical protein
MGSMYYRPVRSVDRGVESTYFMTIMARGPRLESIPSRSRPAQDRYWTARPLHSIVDPRGYLQAALEPPRISRPFNVAS